MKNYNTKEFLLPRSADSMAAYHAKTEGNNESYKLTISDCNRSVRLHGKLNTLDECNEALSKLQVLKDGIDDLQSHIVRIINQGK